MTMPCLINSASLPSLYQGSLKNLILLVLITSHAFRATGFVLSNSFHAKALLLLFIASQKFICFKYLAIIRFGQREFCHSINGMPFQELKLEQYTMLSLVLIHLLRFASLVLAN